MMFIPATSFFRLSRRASACSTPAPWESSSVAAAAAARAEQLFTGQAALAVVRLTHLILLKMSTALLPNAVE